MKFLFISNSLSLSLSLSSFPALCHVGGNPSLATEVSVARRITSSLSFFLLSSFLLFFLFVLPYSSHCFSRAPLSRDGNFFCRERNLSPSFLPLPLPLSSALFPVLPVFSLRTLFFSLLSSPLLLSLSLYFSLPILSFLFPLLSPLLSRTRACARNRRSGRSLPLFLSTSSLLSFFHLSSFSRAFFIFFSPPPFSLLAAHFSPSTTRAEETSSCPYSSRSRDKRQRREKGEGRRQERWARKKEWEERRETNILF